MNRPHMMPAMHGTAWRTLILLAAISAAAVSCHGTTEPNVPPSSQDAVAKRVFASLDVNVFGSSQMAAILGMNARYLEVHAIDQNGIRMPVTRGSFSIVSSDSNVVRVTDSQFGSASSNGNVDETWIEAHLAGIGPGTAVVSISWTTAGVTKTATTSAFTVRSTEGWSLKFDPSALTLHVGSREQLHAAMLDEAGNPVASMGDVFSVDRAEIAELQRSCFECPEMFVAGLAPGEATITIRWDRLLATAAVTVLP